MSSSDKHYSRVVDDVSLPYRTNVNPLSRSQQPYYIGGSNCMVLSGQPVSRRFGFGPYVPADQVFSTSTAGVGTEVLSRIFTWRRWAGTFFTLICTTNTTASGTSPSSRIWASASSGGAFTLLFEDHVSAEPFDFVVSNNFVFFANGHRSGKWDGTTVSNWGSDGPLVAPGITNTAPGNVPSVVGHTYVFAFGNSVTGYVSDISPVSVPTSVINREWTIDSTGTNDGYIDQIHVYRTEDGGGVYYELDNSPIANPGLGPWTLLDNDFDASDTSTPRLQSQQAPLKSVNLPVPLIKGPKFFAGRIWGFAGDTLYFSGYEEVTNGVPEESWGTSLTNTQSFGDEITGTEVLGGTDTGVLLVFTASRLHFISGSSLGTFRIGSMTGKRGCRQRATIVSGETPVLGPFVAWLDTTNVVRVITLNQGMQDLSYDIRPDIQSIDHSQASMVIHEDGQYRWLILCDGGAGVLRPFDLDRMKWQTPWPVANCTTVWSGEVASGSWRLFLGRQSQADLTKCKVLAMDYTIFADEGVDYASNAIFQMVTMTAEDRPEQVGMLEYVGVEHDSEPLSDLSVLLDEDPTAGSPVYTSILANKVDPFLRKNLGLNLKEDWFYLRDDLGTRRVTAQMSWAADGNNFKLFTFAVVSSRQGKS